jgi:exodeoxyribonuclease X
VSAAAIIFDTETTGLDEPELVESAWLSIDIAGEPAGLVEVSRWKPSKRIQLGALAAHHIMDEELHVFPPSSEFRLPDGVEYLIGHNVTSTGA